VLVWVFVIQRFGSLDLARSPGSWGCLKCLLPFLNVPIILTSHKITNSLRFWYFSFYSSSAITLNLKQHRFLKQIAMPSNTGVSANFYDSDFRDQCSLSDRAADISSRTHLARSLWKAVVSTVPGPSHAPHMCGGCRMHKCRIMHVPCVRLLLHIGESVRLADTALCRHRASSDTVPRQATCASEGTTTTTVDRLGTSNITSKTCLQLTYLYEWLDNPP
jgi:hypothetical protein